MITKDMIKEAILLTEGKLDVKNVDEQVVALRRYDLNELKEMLKSPVYAVKENPKPKKK